jgi:toxin ParE1/3/4
MARIVWTKKAIRDVHNIFLYISEDAPYRASLFIEELIESAQRLENFPLSGRIIPEKNDPTLREIIFRNYRIMFRVKDSLVEILHVVHGARQFDPTMLN